MKILIHTFPTRLWYVNEFLIPSLREQGATEIEVWNDTEHKGNLAACMESFAARKGDGGTWHIQDDVLLSRDFVRRCEAHDNGVVYGFCCAQFTDDPDITGRVYAEDAWHSFQCVRIPDEYARACAAWYHSGEWEKDATAELVLLHNRNRGDDTFFREWFITHHGYETAENLCPNLVEHVDWIIGGSVLHQWRTYLARSDHWDDEDLVMELRQKIKKRNKS